MWACQAQRRKKKKSPEKQQNRPVQKRNFSAPGFITLKKKKSWLGEKHVFSCIFFLQQQQQKAFFFVSNPTLNNSSKNKRTNQTFNRKALTTPPGPNPNGTCVLLLGEKSDMARKSPVQVWVSERFGRLPPLC